MDGQKTRLDKKKHGDGVMVLVRNGNYRRSRNRETQVRRSI